MRRHCLIATATTNKMISSGLAEFLVSSRDKNYEPGDWYYSTVIFEDQKSYAIFRNRAVQMALERPFQRLWFVDNDVIPPADIWNLMRVDGDIVGATVPYSHCMSGAYRKDDEPWGEKASAGLMGVDGMGMACTWISKQVLDDPAMRYPETCDPPAYFRFHYHPNGAVKLGEDFDFCMRAKKLGYKVRLDTRTVCGHVKTVDLRDAIRIAQERVAA